MPASTASTCRRRDSDSVQSQRRSRASSRERGRGMAVTLAQRRGADHRRVPRSGAPMEKFVIEGGVPLSGTVEPAGNKNSALPILAASVLTEDEVVLRNVPRIRDVETMIGLLEHLGVRVEWRGSNELSLSAAGLAAPPVIDRELSSEIRASFLLAGPLLARLGA